MCCVVAFDLVFVVGSAVGDSVGVDGPVLAAEHSAERSCGISRRLGSKGVPQTECTDCISMIMLRCSSFSFDSDVYPCPVK